MMTNDKTGVLQRTVDLKNLQIKNQVVTKYLFEMLFKKFKILQNILFNNII